MCHCIVKSTTYQLHLQKYVSLCFLGNLVFTTNISFHYFYSLLLLLFRLQFVFHWHWCFTIDTIGLNGGIQHFSIDIRTRSNHSMIYIAVIICSIYFCQRYIIIKNILFAVYIRFAKYIVSYIIYSAIFHFILDVIVIFNYCSI